MTRIEIGRRVHTGTKGKGTVRWIGLLEGLDSVRAGIELDSSNPSCHSGDYNGVQYFESPAQCGVFLKLDKVDEGFSVREAAELKYRTKDSDNQSSELVGQAKAEQYFADNLFDLREFGLDEMAVSHIGDGLEVFSRLEKLSLRYTLLSSLRDVQELSTQIPTLRELDVSGNRFVRSYTGSTVLGLTRLVMNECVFACTSDLNRLLSETESLRFLSLNGVQLDWEQLKLPSSLVGFSAQSVGLASWRQIMRITEGLTHLESLDMSENTRLGDLDDPSVLPASLKTFNISNCGISSWCSIKNIAARLPNLTSLKLTGNSVYEEVRGGPQRQLLVAVFSKLEILNNATVSATQRIEAERYIVSLLVKSGNAHWIRDALSEDRIEQLVSQYGQASAKEDTADNTGSTSRRQRMTYAVSLKLPTGGIAALKVPIHCQLSDLRTIVAKRTSWPFKLSEMNIFFSPSITGEDRIELEGGSEVDDLGISDGWFMHVSLSDSD